jgi:phage terminase large subunit-like protein
MSAGFHTACDLTGKYPAQWKGYKFKHAPNILASGVDNQQLKDVVQVELFGKVIDDGRGKKRFAGGWVHRDEIGRVVWSKVTTDLAVSVEVHSSYGRSQCRLRAYTQSKTGQGSLSFAGTSLDKIWVDECPPDDLVGQLVTRTMTGNMGKGGHISYTMTPELGATKLVTNFMEYREDSQQLIGPVSWAECPHLTPELQRTILQGIPEHEQEMRSKGVPYFGSGLVYAIPEARIMCTAYTENGKPITEIPYLKYIRAMDIGINHPTAIVWLAYDPEIDRIYVLRTYSEADSAAAVHAAAANSYLDFAPLVFPHDIDNREKGSGKTVRQYYAEAGLKNTLDFQNPDGSKNVEPGIMEIYDRMRSDRFKVVNDCTGFFREMRLYHRDDGKLVKLNDDIMDAVRYGSMMVARYGVPMGGHRGKRRIRVKKSFT